MVAISPLSKLTNLSFHISPQWAALGCAISAVTGAGVCWAATRDPARRSLPCVLDADFPGGPWIPLATRRSIDLAGARPDWATWTRLEACTAHMEPHVDYIWGSGWPQGAGGGADVDSDFRFARNAIVRGFAAKIVLPELLGPTSPGEILAIPGPATTTFGFEHPFMQVVRGQEIGLLVRLTIEDNVNYWDSDYWTQLENKPVELILDTWPDFGVPDNQAFYEFVLNFAQQAEQQFAAGRRVGVHCRGGLGRTGALIAAYILKRQIDCGTPPDPWGVVLEIRKRRLGLVQTEAQFFQLYDFIQRYQHS